LADSFAQPDAIDAQSSGMVDSVLAGTGPLTAEGDLAMQMIEGIHRFLLAQTDR
jgi:hypothetical protein